MAEVISMPKLGFDMAEGTLVRWVIMVGQSASKGDVLAEIETDKATVEVETAHEGVILRHLVSEGSVVPVNTPIAVIGKEGEEIDLDKLGISAEAAATEQAATEPETAAAAEATSIQPVEEIDTRLPDGVRASPLARRMAADLGIDLRKVTGSGPMGRIVKEDIQNYQPEAVQQVETRAMPTVQQPGALPPAVPALSFEPREDQHVPLSRLRAAIGRRMVEAKLQVPHFYITKEYDMSAVVALRKQINAMLPENEKISVNDFILKAAALTLRLFPNLNASIDTQKNEIVWHGSVNVGVAVAVENGLLTVVCKNSDQKSLRQISLEVKNMAVRARDGKVKPEDIEGSTFSISNLGMYDVDQFVAIINPPEAAILAVGAAKEVPVVSNGEIKPGIRMRATISVDHRVSDGAEAARFMQALTQFLEEPLRLML